MSEGFLKLIRSDYATWLMRNYPWAYLLLNLIAYRACRTLPNNDGLNIGEAHIGDWKSMGATRGQYRHALKVLEKERAIKILETCRNRKKATTGTTTVGTKVRLLNSVVWDINSEVSNHRSDHPTTTERPPNDHEQELKKKKNLKKEEREDKAQPASRLRSKDVLTFDFKLAAFTGISDKDLTDWALMYPHINLQVETLKAAQWLVSNPAKSKKKLWRKYLTGWFGRANESVENKKAYKNAFAASQGQDRRTKDIDGNPVENQYTGMF